MIVLLSLKTCNHLMIHSAQQNSTATLLASLSVTSNRLLLLFKTIRSSTRVSPIAKAFNTAAEESVNPVATRHQADGQAIFFSGHNIREKYGTEPESHHLLLRKLQPVIVCH